MIQPVQPIQRTRPIRPAEVVLHEPEIPNNTGNIGRSCVALGAPLHLIHPLGFELSEKACRRAGLDYWPRLSVTEHGSWNAYEGSTSGARRWMLTTRTERSVYDADFQPGDHLVFGKETAGLPDDLLAEAPDRCLSLPMVDGERSLNLATAVCVVLYEAVRQQVARGQFRVEHGRLSGVSS